jgi:hypothetical protein
MRSVGLLELVFVLAIALLYAFPYGASLKHGFIRVVVDFLACLPGINIVVAYFLAFTDWPVLRELV